MRGVRGARVVGLGGETNNFPYKRRGKNLDFIDNDGDPHHHGRRHYNNGFYERMIHYLPENYFKTAYLMANSCKLTVVLGSFAPTFSPLYSFMAFATAANVGIDTPTPRMRGRR